MGSVTELEQPTETPPWRSEFLAFVDECRKRGAVRVADGDLVVEFAAPPAPPAQAQVQPRVMREATETELQELDRLRAMQRRYEELP